MDQAEFLGDLAAQPIELLIHADDALAHELNRVHQPIADYAEVSSRLRGARRDLAAEIGLDSRGARRDRGADLGHELRLEL